jgi:hypothetical protein
MHRLRYAHGLFSIWMAPDFDETPPDFVWRQAGLVAGAH